MKAKYLSLLLAAVLLGQTPVLAREKKEKAKTEQTAKDKKTDQKEKKKKSLFGKKKKDTPAPASKDSVKTEKPKIERDGLFRVTKQEAEWYFEIPDSLIGREFLTTTRYTSTPASIGKFGGEQVNQQTVYFQEAPDDNLLLRARLFINVADTAENINRAITISNENPIIGTFKIESHKDKVYKIKVGGFFNSDNSLIRKLVDGMLLLKCPAVISTCRDQTAARR